MTVKISRRIRRNAKFALSYGLRYVWWKGMNSSMYQVVDLEWIASVPAKAKDIPSPYVQYVGRLPAGAISAQALLRIGVPRRNP
jgi:hypothetical protein